MQTLEQVIIDQITTAKNTMLAHDYVGHFQITLICSGRACEPEFDLVVKVQEGHYSDSVESSNIHAGVEEFLRRREFKLTAAPKKLASPE